MKIRTTIYIDRDVWISAKREAHMDEMSLSGWIESAIMAAIARKSVGTEDDMDPTRNPCIPQ